MPNYKLVNADQLDTDLTTVADKIREKAELSGKMAFPSGFVSGIDQCSSLNFTVVGGTSQPSSPKENTIWVNTSTTITSWVFSAEQPSSPKSGMVWIQTGDSSNAAFNALKKNNLQVYPLSAKQYVSYSWVDRTAKVHQNGSWIELAGEFDIFNGGVFPNGGSYSYVIDDDHDNEVASIVNGCLYLCDEGKGDSSSIFTTKKYDFTGRNTLIFVCPYTYTSSPGTNFFRFGVISTLPDTANEPPDMVASIQIESYTGDTEQSFEVDVSSLNGEYYVIFSTERYSYNYDEIYVSRIYCK